MTDTTCRHSWVAGMMYVHDEDLATVAAVRTVECEHCDVTVGPGTSSLELDHLRGLAGREPDVIVSQREHESLRETAHLLSTPANARRLLAAVERLDDGKAQR
jgi:hypothetical protein